MTNLLIHFKPICVALLGYSLSLYSSSASAMTLTEAVKIALGNHPRIELAEADLKAAHYIYKQSVSNLGPTISIEADSGFQELDRGLSTSTSNGATLKPSLARITIRQPIFEGWRRVNALKRTSATKRSAAAAVYGAKNNLILDVIQAYLDVRRHRKLLRMANENIERHQSVLKLVQGRVDGGLARASEAEQVKERIASAQTSQSNISLSQENAVATFHGIVGIKPVRLEPAGALPDQPASPEQAVKHALLQHPSLWSANEDIKAAKFSLKEANSAFLPTIYVEASAASGENTSGIAGSYNEYSARAVLSWQIFDNGLSRNRLKERSVRHSRAKLERDLLVRQIEEAVTHAWNTVSDGRRRLIFLKQQVESNRSLVQSYVHEYQAGHRNIINLLDSESALFSADAAHINAEFAHYYANYQLQSVLGTLHKIFLDNTTAPSKDQSLTASKIFPDHFKIDINPLDR